MEKLQAPQDHIPFDPRIVYAAVGALPLKPRTQYWILRDVHGTYHAVTPKEAAAIAENKAPEFEGGFLLWPFWTTVGWG